MKLKAKYSNRPIPQVPHTITIHKDYPKEYIREFNRKARENRFAQKILNKILRD